MVSIETISGTNSKGNSGTTESNTVNYHNSPHPNLSKPQIILLSLIFTILQNLSLSKLVNARPIILIISFLMVAFVFFYLLHKIPLSTELFIKKTRLVVQAIKSSTDGLNFDVCVIIICILLFGWIISVWKNFLSVLLWAIVIWIYNLTGNNGMNGNASPILLNSASPLGATNNYKYFTESSESSFQASAFKYINILERKIDELNKLVEELENSKVQQSILIYTFNHKMTERLDNLEKTFQEKNNQLYKKFMGIQTALETLTHRKRARLAISKMYVKQILLVILPNPVVSSLRIQKKLILAVYEKFQSFGHYFKSR